MEPEHIIALPIVVGSGSYLGVYSNVVTGFGCSGRGIPPGTSKPNSFLVLPYLGWIDKITAEGGE